MTNSDFPKNERPLPPRIQMPRLGAQQRKFLVRLLMHRGYWHAEARWGRDTVSETRDMLRSLESKGLVEETDTGRGRIYEYQLTAIGNSIANWISD